MDSGRETRANNATEERPWTSSKGSSSTLFLLEPLGTVHGDDKRLSSREKSVIQKLQSRFQESCHKKCKNTKLYNYACLTCSTTGPWYSAIATDGSGAVHGVFNARGRVDTLVANNYKTTGPMKFSKLDIALPISGNEDELQEFCESLGVALKTFRKSPIGRNISIRLLFTRYTGGSSSTTPLDKLRNQVSNQTKLEADKVILLDVEDTYSRENAIFHLHQSTCTEADCIIAMLDAGLVISASSLYTAHELVQSGHSAYIPIVWSEYDPELVQLELEYYSNQGMKLRDPYDDHRGVWANETTFPIYMVSGADASKLKMNEKGGVELDDENGVITHFQRTGLNVVRLQDYGWIQRFNSNKAQTNSEPKMGKYLRDLRQQNETEFRSMIGRNQYEGDVFLAVVTSRKSLSSRVLGIRESWGHLSNLRPNIHVRYFVGNGSQPKSELLREGAFENADELVVMEEVADDEYPPVRKNVNMLKTINRMVHNGEGSLRNANVGYIMKVDDDSYVNFDGLLKFLAYHDNSSQAFQFWGDRGFGRKKDREGIRNAGLSKAYCLGGPGYILSQQALEAASRGFDECVDQISRSPHKEAVWHSDVVISICITKATDVGCFDNDDDYRRNRVFANNYFSYENFVHKDDLHRVVSMHAYKKRGQMMRQHQRFLKRIVDQANDEDKDNILIQKQDEVIFSDRVYQNVEQLPMTPDFQLYQNSWIVLFVLLLLMGWGTKRKRIFRKVCAR